MQRTAEATSSMWETARRFVAEHGHAAMATVVATWGSAPVPVGGQLAAGPGDRFEGSVSGGCVEADVLAEAADAMASGKPKLLEYGVSDDAAWRVGLACGGTIRVFVEPLSAADLPLLDAIVAAHRARQSAVLVTSAADGARHLYAAGAEMPAEVAAQQAAGTTALIEGAAGQLVVQPVIAPVHIVVVGATHIGQVFTRMARLVGYSVTVVDPRAAFATAERLGSTASIVEWPAASLDKLGLGGRTAVVALTHAAHIDDEAIAAALRAPCLYVGALGSRATHAKRLQRLAAAGFSEAELQRIHAPIGLAIGAKGAPEIAVSILAEIIKVTRDA